MSPNRFIRRTLVHVPVEGAFTWHTRPGVFERLVPPWIRCRVLSRTDGIQDGARIRLLLRHGPFRFNWLIEHFDYVRGRQFCARQVSGPFATWEHRHLFEAEGADACHIEDRVEYELPFWPLGWILTGRHIRREFERLFVYRHRILQQDLAMCLAYCHQPSLRILVTGASGFIGTALVPFLTSCGHAVTRLARARRSDGHPRPVWDPAQGRLDLADLEGYDAVIHLAGENLARRRWTRGTKRRIRESRVRSTRLLCEALARLRRPPHTLLAASAIGYYGHRDRELLHEGSLPGQGFLPDLCLEWEAATRPADDRGIRVVNLRFGVILSPAGGVLAQMLPAYRCGLGGSLGTGWPMMSWIAMDDVIGVIHHALLTESLQGPVNVVSPRPVTNREFARTLGRVLNRPALLRLPAFLLRALLGEMARETLLASLRVEPRRLLESGYAFRFPDLEEALRHVLGRT